VRVRGGGDDCRLKMGRGKQVKQVKHQHPNRDRGRPRVFKDEVGTGAKRGQGSRFGRSENRSMRPMSNLRPHMPAPNQGWATLSMCDGCFSQKLLCRTNEAGRPKKVKESEEPMEGEESKENDGNGNMDEEIQYNEGGASEGDQPTATLKQYRGGAKESASPRGLSGQQERRLRGSLSDIVSQNTNLCVFWLTCRSTCAHYRPISRSQRYGSDKTKDGCGRADPSHEASAVEEP